MRFEFFNHQLKGTPCYVFTKVWQKMGDHWTTRFKDDFLPISVCYELGVRTSNIWYTPFGEIEKAIGYDYQMEPNTRELVSVECGKYEAKFDIHDNKTFTRHEYDKSRYDGMQKKSIKGHVLEKVVYENEYDTAGRLSVIKRSSERGGKKELSVWKYDSDGNLVDVKNGSIRRVYVYEKGHLILEEHRSLTSSPSLFDNGDGERVVSRTIMEYDDVGRMVKKYCSDKNGKLIRHERVEYDANGSLISRTSIQDGNTSFIRHEGSTIKSLHGFTNSDGEISIRTSDTVLNEYGDVWIKTDHISTKGRRKKEWRQNNPRTVSYKYEYDSVGNWILLEVFKDGRIVWKILRELKYYESNDEK